MKKHAKGFTLIELMIVVAVIGIIASFAMPSYKNYVIRGNRSAAESFMMDIANREKQYLLDARVYVADAMGATGAVTTLNLTAPKAVYTYYTIAIAAPGGNPPSFTVTATPVAGTIQASDGTLTLNDTGSKTWGAATNW